MKVQRMNRREGEGARRPVHTAVALRYADGPAPVIVAKGREHLAEQIVRIAERAGVPMVDRGDLADGLFVVPSGEFIPEEYYRVVAELLAFVYRMEGRAAGSSRGAKDVRVQR